MPKSQKKKKVINKRKALPKILTAEFMGSDEEGEYIVTPNLKQKQFKNCRIKIKNNKINNAHKLPRGAKLLIKTEKSEDQGYDYEADIIRILSNVPKRLIGVFERCDNVNFLHSINKKLRRSFVVKETNKDIPKLEDGDIVTAEVIGGKRRDGVTNVRAIIYHGNLQKGTSASILSCLENEIPTEFTPNVEGELLELERNFNKVERKDLSHLPFLTIDPSDARDFDDAVCVLLKGASDAVATCDRENSNSEGGFDLYVAIADVGFYVKPNSSLDMEAQERGNSVYFPDMVIPMLPELLSNNLCSLRAKEPRPTLVAKLSFSKDGKKISHEFIRAFINVRQNLSYELAQDYLVGGQGLNNNGSVPKPLTDVIETALDNLFYAFKILDKNREYTAPLELNIAERHVEFNTKGEIKAIRLKKNLTTHRLIEEFMIEANIAAAQVLEKKLAPIMYRIHDKPSLEKLENLRMALLDIDNNFSYNENKLMPEIFNKILRKAKNTYFEDLISMLVLRSQAQACYSPNNIGHFGLNLRQYAHFTSPIRRYADILVHRALITALSLGDDGLEYSDRNKFEAIGEKISQLERRAVVAERSAFERMITNYLFEKMGQKIEGVVSGVNKSGLFIQLKGTGADGLIPIAEIANEYHFLEEEKHLLVGEETGNVYRLGDRVMIEIIEAIPLKGLMRFKLLENLDQKKHGRVDISKLKHKRRKFAGKPKRFKRGSIR